MEKVYTEFIEKSPRIPLLVEGLFGKMPEIEVDRAVLITESYKKTEHLPMVMRRALAFKHILENIPITIRDNELVVGAATKSPRSCQIFPEYSFQWILDEIDTVGTRAADPFYISEENKKTLKEVCEYWRGKTTSEYAQAMMTPETIDAINHNIFTVGNYFYNGVGHVTVNYGEVLEKGYDGIIKKAQAELSKCKISDADYIPKTNFLNAVIICCNAACDYALRYSVLAKQMADNEANPLRKQELLNISKNCARVPRYGAESFYEACQSFWFIQMLVQTESNGHSVSPGRFDMYMYPYYKKDMDKGNITREEAQELVDCVWVKLNDLNKIRDKASAEGFAGYSVFQNLIAGGQTRDGRDATNDLSYMSINATMHVFLPQPSFSVRVWNKSPHEFLIRAAELTRTGIGFPAYYNDEVIIPALVNRGLTIEDAREYNIIGCVEPQKSGKTEGWHDAAFFNMCRPLELVFSNGVDNGKQIGPVTGDVTNMTTFEEFYDAYKAQVNYMIELMVNADNAVDIAHATRCPLPFLSSMIEDCIGRGKSSQEGGAVYNFTGPQGFGVANMADSLYVIKKLVYDDKKVTMEEFKEALLNNYGYGVSDEEAKDVVISVATGLAKEGVELSNEQIGELFNKIKAGSNGKYDKLLEMINEIPKFGNDDDLVDSLARDVAYTYTKPLEKYKNPRGGSYQAGLYPVSANVPLGKQTGATPDGRLAGTPVADGVSPSAGKDICGPTAAANSVSKLDHFIASNGTLYNMKFHPSALKGRAGLESFVSLVRGYFDQKGSHMQFNVVSRETLKDAQKNPDKYRSLVVRVAGYSALFTTLSKSLQDDIINRTEQGGF